MWLQEADELASSCSFKHCTYASFAVLFAACDDATTGYPCTVSFLVLFLVYTAFAGNLYF